MIKVKLVLIVVLGIILTGIFAIPGYAVKLEDVVGMWLFDEGRGDVAIDSSGNGQDGEILADVKREKGKFGNALDFPGKVTETSYVRVPYNEAQDLVEHSVTAWIKATPTPGDWGVILCKWQPHDVRNYGIHTMKDSGELISHVTNGAGKYMVARGRTPVTDDQWHHVACTYDGTFLRVYIDGVMEGEIVAGEPDTNPGDLTIGARWGGTHPTTGLIDDVALFKVALDEDEIQEIMTQGLQEFFGLAAVEPADKLTTTWGEIRK